MTVTAADLLNPRRLAEWADLRFLRAVTTILLLTDAAVGLVWLLTSPARLTSPAYSVAKHLAPMTTWGALFTCAAAATAAVLLARGASWMAGYLLGPLTGGLWVGWTILFGLAPLGSPDASYVGLVFAASLACLHLLAGLVVAHRPGAPEGR